jgi:hypothetical protein
MKMAVFWEVALCSLVDTDWCFTGGYCSIIKAWCTSQKTATFKHISMRKWNLNSPHVQPLLLKMILTKELPPPVFLWPPQTEYWRPDLNHDMSHYMNQIYLTVNPCSSVKPPHPYQSWLCFLIVWSRNSFITTFCTTSNWYMKITHLTKVAVSWDAVLCSLVMTDISGELTASTVSQVAQSAQCLATGWMKMFNPRQRWKDFSCSLCIQTGSGAHPASCTMGTGGPFSGDSADHPLLVSRLRMSSSYTSSPTKRLHGM